MRKLARPACLAGTLPIISLRLAVGLAATCLGPSSTIAQDVDIVIADFESDDYGAWTVTGTAFGPGPARGTLPQQMEVSGYEGTRLVNSYFGGDDATGTLTSPPFAIERNYVNFLIGGGKYPGQTCVNLLVDGQVARTATGPNDRPGGTERLDWCSWDVTDLRGRQAVLQIVDQRQGGWGHINVDQIVLSDRPREVGPARRELLVTHRYLHLPVKNGAPMVRMKVTVNGTIIDEFDMELAPSEPDFWVFLDLERYQQQQATIDVVRLSTDSQGLSLIHLDPDVPGAATLYRERFRPQFHFSPRVGWNNDPNGLVYHAGEWHLYFQHNPYGWNWGNMHWGHAVSADLVHWTELPIAIYPRRYDDWVFSGGAIVDRNNSGGFKSGSEDTIVAAFTSTARGEAIAYSHDRGRTFTEYEGNPVIRHQGRDPKIIWYAPGKHWVLAVYDEEGTGADQKQRIAFYTSDNLKQWTRQSKLDGYFECPEIFELPVDGDKAHTRWVVYAADGAYQLGSFDGRTFTPDDATKQRYNWGNCFYASQTFSDVPPEDGRRIQIAWGQIGHREMPFNQQMNFPVELTLHTTADGLRMFANPVREIARLHAASRQLRDVPIVPDQNPLAEMGSELLHIQAEIWVGDARQIDLSIRGQQIIYDAHEQTLQCLDRQAPLPLRDACVQLEILVDRLSIEIFGNGGRVYMPMGMVIDPDNTRLAVAARGGTATIRSMTVHQLHSAWRR